MYKQAEKQLSDFEMFANNNKIILVSEVSAKNSGKNICGVKTTWYYNRNI